jgi:hypothetical protein
MKKSLTLLALLLILKLVHAQNLQVSTTIITQPCTNNGEIQINTTGGAMPYTYYYYVWPTVTGVTPILTNNIVSGLPPSTIYITVVDSLGASFSTNVSLNSPIQTTITSTPAICPALGEIQITNTGNGPFVDELYANNILLATGSPFSNLAPDIYLIKTSDANGCFVISDSVYVENISGLNVSLASSNITCQGGTLTATVVGGLSPYTYSWSSGNSTTNVMNGPIGSHTVNVTDAQGCNQMGWGNLSSPIYISNNAVVAPTSCPSSNGSITVFPTGGTAPYVCNWSNGYTGNSISNLNYGVYHATIIDAAGCTGEVSAYVPTINSIYTQISTTYSSCLIPTGEANLTISGGTPPYSVDWSTNPQQSGISLTNVLPGNYAFVITDANGCVNTGSATIGVLDPISSYPSVTHSTCGLNNGAIATYASGSSLTYLWSNGSTQTNLTNIPGGAYSCVITNATGCTKLISAYVNSNSPFNVGSNITNASCIFVNDGQIVLNITGGTPPYNITWNTGATGASINNLIKGDYYATISDANGCNFSYHYTVGYLSTSPCACSLTGKVYFDANNNCTFDNGEIALSNVNIKLNSGTSAIYSITNTDGNYNFFVPTGTYTIEQLPFQHYSAGACSNNPITVNAAGGTNCAIVNNFADTAPAIQDLSTTYINVQPAVVGYGYMQRILVKNQGTTAANNAMVNMRGNYNASVISTTFAGNNVPGTGNWNFTNLPTLEPNETFLLDLNYTVSNSIPTNTLLLYTDTVQKSAQPWLQDETPWNNIYNLQTYTVASLDPNYKEVSPQGTGVNGDINFSDSILTYTVHFENTGTYYAYNIEIVDSVSNNLELNSLEMIYGSHPYIATIDENRVLHIKFNNIMLGWQDNNNTGFAVYSIKLKNNLPIGAQIKNTAYIYFDFNEAVITNTTINTLTSNVGKEELTNAEYNLFPNPVSNRLTITNNVNTLKGTINIYDSMGKLWHSKTITQPINKVDFNNLDELTNGLYFVNLINENGEVKTIKFIKN